MKDQVFLFFMYRYTVYWCVHQQEICACIEKPYLSSSDLTETKKGKKIFKLVDFLAVENENISFCAEAECRGTHI